MKWPIHRECFPTLSGERPLMVLQHPNLRIDLGQSGGPRGACHQTDQTHRCRHAARGPLVGQFPPCLESFAVFHPVERLQVIPPVDSTCNRGNSTDISSISVFAHRSWFPPSLPSATLPHRVLFPPALPPTHPHWRCECTPRTRALRASLYAGECSRCGCRTHQTNTNMTCDAQQVMHGHEGDNDKRNGTHTHIHKQW